ncbi:hypothetical protein CJ030_MR1G002252 [Morella rubra]|uniref:Uncharacterized protein n=1 Tax=Morella rubra TaxID=262757 RepID=A0A6A1WS23_9ROSI|nr:hypothetical protein CJ030_MR1G002252 [Morella rubra]
MFVPIYKCANHSCCTPLYLLPSGNFFYVSPPPHRKPWLAKALEVELLLAQPPIMLLQLL